MEVQIFKNIVTKIKSMTKTEPDPIIAAIQNAIADQMSGSKYSIEE